MKILATLMIALTTLSAVAQDKPITTTYKVDAVATTVGWTAKKIVGGHNGNVATKDGFITLTGDLITSGEINIDLKTITVADIPATDEHNAKLVGHLKSPDFFDVDKHPTAKLVIKSSEKTNKGLKIKGDMTFHGKTNPIEFDAIVTKAAGAFNAKSDITLNRIKWDVKYNSGDFFKDLGDKAIKNDFVLSINVVAKK